MAEQPEKPVTTDPKQSTPAREPDNLGRLRAYAVICAFWGLADGFLPS